MILFPNAKINLGLCITGKRPDGYHDISTVMLPVGWCDILEIVPGTDDGVMLHTDDDFGDCRPENNLVLKALHALEDNIEIIERLLWGPDLGAALPMHHLP